MVTCAVFVLTRRRRRGLMTAAKRRCHHRQARCISFQRGGQCRLAAIIHISNGTRARSGPTTPAARQPCRCHNARGRTFMRKPRSRCRCRGSGCGAVCAHNVDDNLETGIPAKTLCGAVLARTGCTGVADRVDQMRRGASPLAGGAGQCSTGRRRWWMAFKLGPRPPGAQRRAASDRRARRRGRRLLFAGWMLRVFSWRFHPFAGKGDWFWIISCAVTLVRRRISPGS